MSLVTNYKVSLFYDYLKIGDYIDRTSFFVPIF